MGNFYVNHSVKGATQADIVAILEREGRTAFVTPRLGDTVVVYDYEADGQAVESVIALGEILSREGGGTTLAVLNHDDDLLRYWLFKEGALVDLYKSNPDHTESEPWRMIGNADDPPSRQDGDARVLCATMAPGTDPTHVEAILRAVELVPVELHERLAEALGLPSCSVGLGYEYVDRGELEELEGITGEVHVGPRPA